VEVLLHFLQALPDSVIPTAMYEQALHVADDANRCRELVAGLPRVNRFTVYYITSFVKMCVEPQNAQYNFLDIDTAGNFIVY
jgi:hypothetical protein